MSVDFEEKEFLPPIDNRYYGDRPIGAITKIFMSLGLGRNPDIAQWFVLVVAIIFFALAAYIYFF